MIYMLVINKNLPIMDSDMLEVFKSQVIMESYDDKSRELALLFCNYLDEIFKVDKKAEKEVLKRIGPEVIPVVNVNTDISEFQQLNFTAVSTVENYQIKKSDEIILQDICYKQFKNVKSLLDRIANSTK